MKKRKIKISEAEWLVLHVLWDKSPIKMGEIVNTLSHTPWKRTTIQTMVLRLISKNLVETDGEGHAFLYRPIITREEALKTYTKLFVERTYNNNGADLIKELINEEYFSDAEKQEIKKML